MPHHRHRPAKQHQAHKTQPCVRVRTGCVAPNRHHATRAPALHPPAGAAGARTARMWAGHACMQPKLGGAPQQGWCRPPVRGHKTSVQAGRQRNEHQQKSPASRTHPFGLQCRVQPIRCRPYERKKPPPTISPPLAPGTHVPVPAFNMHTCLPEWVDGWLPKCTH